MDKLKLAFKLVAEQAKAKRRAGSVPAFLGVRGMLALMYDRIASFSQEDEDNTKYVLDLAVSAMFAFSTVLPDMDFDEVESEAEEELPEEPQEEDIVDPRWTKVPPGQPLPSPTPHQDDDDTYAEQG